MATMVLSLLLSRSLLFFLALVNLGINVVSVRGGAANSVEEACGNIDFSSNQEKHYGKSAFVQHSSLAETIGDLLNVFYNDEEGGGWSITPADLQEIVLSNIHKGTDGVKIYGSAIAFEPNLWQQTFGLQAGVPFPAASEACLSLSHEYCEGVNATTINRTDTLAVTSQKNETLYCPYAYHGSPQEKAFAKCSADTPEFCPSMDLARAYDYSETTNPDVEWYTAPRCLFFQKGIRSGYWTSPYFDAGAGNINMVTYSQPILKGDTFLGIATIDIEVDALCYGNQCDHACPAQEYTYTVSDDCQGRNAHRMVSYSTNDPSCPIDPEAVSTLTCSYVPVSSSAGILTMVLCGAGALICSLVLILVLLKRESSIIRASQVNISCGFILGAILANLSPLATLSLANNPDVACKLWLWAAVLPLTIMLAFLFGKVYRMHRILVGAKNNSRHPNNNKRAAILSDSNLLGKICLVVLVQVTILIVWTVVEQPTLTEQTMNESVDGRYCTGEDCFPTEEVCTQQHGIVGLFSVLYLAVIVIVGCVLSFQSRDLPNCFSEAKYVMFAMYNFALNGVILLVVLLTGGDDLSVAVQTLLQAFATVVTATGSVLLIFSPKFITLWNTPEEQLQRNLRESVVIHMASAAAVQGHKDSSSSQEQRRKSRRESRKSRRSSDSMMADDSRRSRSAFTRSCESILEEEDDEEKERPRENSLKIPVTPREALKSFLEDTGWSTMEPIGPEESSRASCAEGPSIFEAVPEDIESADLDILGVSAETNETVSDNSSSTELGLDSSKFIEAVRTANQCQ